MPNPREALTGSQQRAVAGKLLPRAGARSEITALGEPYMLTIQGGRRSIECQGKDQSQQRTNRPKPLRESRRGRFLGQTQSGDGSANQLPDACLALRFMDRQNGGGSVAFEGLRFSTELGE
jgi:hypothetical protein